MILCDENNGERIQTQFMVHIYTEVELFYVISQRKISILEKCCKLLYRRKINFIAKIKYQLILINVKIQ